MIFGEENGPWVIGVVSKTSSFFQGGPAVRIPFAPAGSPVRTIEGSRLPRMRGGGKKVIPEDLEGAMATSPK